MPDRPEEPSAFDAFIARKAETDDMIERLKTLSDEHFGFSPEEVNWGHVGLLSDYAALLRRITDAAFREGEYAA